MMNNDVMDSAIGWIVRPIVNYYDELYGFAVAELESLRHELYVITLCAFIISVGLVAICLTLYVTVDSSGPRKRFCAAIWILALSEASVLISVASLVLYTVASIDKTSLWSAQVIVLVAAAIHMMVGQGTIMKYAPPDPVVEKLERISAIAENLAKDDATGPKDQ